MPAAESNTGQVNEMARTLIDLEYRRHVRRYPCVVAVRRGVVKDCLPPVQACHVLHSGFGGKDVPDHYNLWPGCVVHHSEQHHIGRESFDKKYEFSVREIAERVGREILEGVEFPDEPYGVKVAHL